MDDAVLDTDHAYEYVNTPSFEFQRGGKLAPSHKSKSTPFKWADAEKWVVTQSPGEAPVKCKDPIHGHQGCGTLPSGKKVMVLNHQKWQSPRSHAPKNGFEDSVLLMESGVHHSNVKLVSMSPCDDLPGEKTKNMDTAKATAAVPNFAFIPVPVPLLKGSSGDCYPTPDDLADMKEVSVLHESNNEGAYLKPTVSRIRKPTSDSLVAGGPYGSPAPAVRSVSMRDMGTEMTPMASQEHSRTGTPIRATTPTLRSPSSSSPSTPRHGSPTSSPIQAARKVSMSEPCGKGRKSSGKQTPGCSHAPVGGKVGIISWASKEEEDADASKSLKTIDLEEVKKNVLETKAAAWEEAEQTKYMARFKREEAKIISWENHEKSKAEAEMRRIEMKLEKKKAQAQEKLVKKLSAAKQKAEERHVAAEARRSERASRTAHRAEYIRQTGRLPSFFGCGFCYFGG